MNPKLKPWAMGPFEVLLHAEMHYRIGEDFDRRIAMIGFDNAIEVAITTYLSLHPMQRGNRQYPKVDVEKWLDNYHTKVGFFFGECSTRAITVLVQQDEVIYFHEVRNRQYHVGGAEIPQQQVLDGARDAAIEIFGVLFDQKDVLALLGAYIAAKHPLPAPRSKENDKLIDDEYGLIKLCGQMEYASELLHALDPNRYNTISDDLKAASDGNGDA